jgi:hypothetical protein
MEGKEPGIERKQKKLHALGVDQTKGLLMWFL